jgi:decaprenyl-phosphate phosphoribosyltransferase
VTLPYLKALRPRQWTKNLIVFAAPLFGFSMTLETLAGSSIAFALFCCLSSSFYLFNDLIDVESDRQHPTKSQRPIAAGVIPIPTAIAMAVGLLVGSLALGFVWSFGLGMFLLAYAALQVAYNLRLKRTVILDVIAISAGFVIRACAGAAATNIVASPWFLVCTAMLALFLGVEKRKAELRFVTAQGGKTRPVLRRYSLDLLTRMESVITTGTIITYALWSAGPQLNGASTPWMLVTLPFVLYGVFRYQLLSDPGEVARRNKDEESAEIHTERPEEILLEGRPHPADGRDLGRARLRHPAAQKPRHHHLTAPEASRGDACAISGSGSASRTYCEREATFPRQSCSRLESRGRKQLTVAGCGE